MGLIPSESHPLSGLKSPLCLLPRHLPREEAPSVSYLDISPAKARWREETGSFPPSALWTGEVAERSEVGVGFLRYFCPCRAMLTNWALT